jgi:uncharacterized repeat protein (TIGR01451 family)
LLVLVAVAALLPVFTVNAQDVSRLCLTRAIAHGQISADACLANALDRASFGGHLYSDKAPGMSLLELPGAEALRLRPIDQIEGLDSRLWGVRLLGSGVAFLVCAFLVGRVAEGLVAGTGAPSLVAFALGTLVMPFAAANFSHVPAAALGFGAFLLAWRRRPLAAGLAAGLGCFVEYQSALVAVVLAVYVVVRRRRALAAYLAGLAPGIGLLLAYDTLAFGSPLHTPYRYLANGFSLYQDRGLFGIGAPQLRSTYDVFGGSGGLLVVSPVLLAAAAGLVLLARAHRAEAVVCGAVTALYVLLNCGYFLPYGGISPGPRFLVPALPFLAVGLGPAFGAHPRLTSLLAGLSVLATTALTLVWANDPPLPRTIWRELVRVPLHGGSTRFVRSLEGTALGFLGVGRTWGAGAVALAALGAFVLAVVRLPRQPLRWRRSWPAAALAGSVCLIAIADAAAVGNYPYAHDATAELPFLRTSITGNAAATAPGQEVDFVVSLTNLAPGTTTGVLLTVSIPPGMRLLGRPWYDRGVGCSGEETVVCNFDYQEPGMTSSMRFGVRVEPGTVGKLKVRAWGSSHGDRAPQAAFTVVSSQRI